MMLEVRYIVCKANQQEGVGRVFKSAKRLAELMGNEVRFTLGGKEVRIDRSSNLPALLGSFAKAKPENIIGP